MALKGDQYKIARVAEPRDKIDEKILQFCLKCEKRKKLKTKKG